MIAAKLASAHNDWVLERYLQPEPRLRGLIAISPQNPQAAAKEIRRVGGRDEFVGIFLPGGARIPYGNPVHDPIWEAANELALPVVVHTHYEGVGIAGPVTAAGYPDFYVEYHTLCGSGMYGHFVSILCHGIFERFPDTKVMMVEGGLVPFVGLMWRLDTNWKACRSEIPWCRKPPSEYVWDHVKFSSQPLETPEDPSLLVPAIQGLRPWDTLCFASDYPHWDYDEPAQTLRMLPSEWRENVAWRNAAEFYGLPGAGGRLAMATATAREARLPLAEAPAEGERRLVELGGRTIGVFRVDGAFFALADRCPHRAAPLCSSGEVVNAVEGVGDEVRVTREGALVRCPWHKWDFDIATGRCTVDARLRVRRYAAWVDGEELVVSLDARPGRGLSHSWSLAQTSCTSSVNASSTCVRRRSGCHGEREHALAEHVVERERDEAAGRVDDQPRHDRRTDAGAHERAHGVAVVGAHDHVELVAALAHGVLDAAPRAARRSAAAARSRQARRRRAAGEAASPGRRAGRTGRAGARSP